MSPTSRSTDALVGLLAERVVADSQLDLAGVVAQVDEGGLAVSAPGDDASGEAVGEVGMLAGLQLRWVVGGVQLGDLGALARGNVRERLDPLCAQALGLGEPFVRDGVVKRVIEHVRSPQEGTSGSRSSPCAA